MNTLTKNRILQEGDEYFEPKGGKGWTPVPENDYGLQVMFTKYAEVRRPSEKPFPVPNGSSNESHPVPTHAEAQTSEGVKRGDRTHTAAGKPILNVTAKLVPMTPEQLAIQADAISPDSGKSVKTAPVAKAEGDTKSPVASHSATGDAPYTIEEGIAVANASKHLSPAALENFKKHLRETPPPSQEKAIYDPTGTAPFPSQESDRAIIDKIPFHKPLTDEEQAALDREIERQPKLIPVAPVKSSSIKISFPPVSAGSGNTVPIWTGRNGTFSGYGLDCMKLEGDRVGVLPPDDHIMLSPIGKRGVGNCTIQFPVSVIPELVDWLKAQLP